MRVRDIEDYISRLENKSIGSFSNDRAEFYNLINKYGLEEYTLSGSLCREAGKLSLVSEETKRSFNKFKAEYKDYVANIEKYGAESKYGCMYPIIDSMNDIINILNSKDAPVINSLVDRLYDYTGRIVGIADYNSYNSVVSSIDLLSQEKKFYTQDTKLYDFVIAGLIVDFENAFNRHKKIFSNTLYDMLETYRKYIDKNTIRGLESFKNFIYIGDFLGSCNYDSIYTHILPNYTKVDVSRVWPANNNVLGLLEDKLKDLDFNESKASKMQLLGTKKYKGLKPWELMVFLIIKEMVYRIRH